LVRENISFQRGLNPKVSLGIGEMPIVIKNSIKNIFKEDFKNTFIAESTPGNILSIEIKYIDYRLTFIIGFYSNNFVDEQGKIINKKEYAISLVKKAGIHDCLDEKILSFRGRFEYDMKFIIKKYYETYFESIKGLHMIHEYDYLKESFSFQRGIDPKAALGIGISFATLSIGAILKPKKMGIALTKNHSGQFTDWRSGWKLWPEGFLLVVRIKGTKYKEIEIVKSVSFNYPNDGWLQVKEWKEVLINTGDYRPWARNRMIVSEKMFNNRFEIIERGI
jgi:hypothetical protein